MAEAEEQRRLQHLVSKGYQANFADGLWVSILDAKSGAVLEAKKSIRVNWRLEDFLSVITTEDDKDVVDDELEKEFAKRERVFLNRVRDITPSKKATPEQKEALDLLAAVHLVRSLAFRERRETVADEWLSRLGQQRALANPELLRRFIAEKHRQPRSGELEAMVKQAAEALGHAPDRHVNGIRYGAARLKELFDSWTIQLITIDESLPGVVLADHPILFGSNTAGQFGFQSAGPVGEAEIIIVPIKRRLAACYSPTQLRHRTIVTKAGLDWINSLLIRGAVEEVACHPDDAVATSRLIRNLDRYPPAGFNTARLR